MPTTLHLLKCFQLPVSPFLIMQPKWPIDYQHGTMKVRDTDHYFGCVQLYLHVNSLDNNKLKRDLYQDLNDFWKLAIQTTSSNLRQGECYSSESVSDWAKRYSTLKVSTADMQYSSFLY